MPFDPYAPEICDDPYPAYAHYRATEPVHYNGDLDFWFLFSYADVMDALKNHAAFSSSRWLFLEAPIEGIVRNMQTLDPPKHDYLRKMALDTFTGRRISALEPSMRATARELLCAFRERGEADLSREFAWRYPATIICELLGVPAADRDPFYDWSVTLAIHGGTGEGGVAANRAIMDYFDGLVREREARRTGDLISALIDAEADGHRLSHEDVVAACYLILIAGHETTTHLLGNTFAILGQRPDLRKRLIEEPALLRGTAVDELLRYVSPTQGLSRTTTREVEIGGKTLPEGARVHILFGSANRDEKVFERADEIDLDRSPNHHLAFGFGIHYCLGSKLATLETQVALEETLPVLGDYELAVERVPRHRSPLLRSIEALPVRFAPSAASA